MYQDDVDAALNAAQELVSRDLGAVGFYTDWYNLYAALRKLEE